MNNNELKALGIAFNDNEILAAAYAEHKALIIIPVYAMSGIALDLNALPNKPFNFKEVFLQWALKANESRIIAGRQPLFTMGLVQACPLWKLTPCPFINLRLDKESLLKMAGRSNPVIGTASGGAIKQSNRNIK